MEESELCPSKPSLPMAFPPYRRRHLRSKTYHTLLHILAHFPPSTVPTLPLNIPDNDNDRTGKDNQEKEPECSNLKAGSDLMDPKSPVPQKEIDEVHETVEGVGDQSRDTSTVEMVLDDIELLIGREEMKQMDELDDGLILLDSGLCEKPNSGSEVDLMDYQVEDVEFLHIDANTSGNSNELQVPEELNQLGSEGFHVSTSTKGLTTSNLNQELVKSDCVAVGDSPLVEDCGFEKEEQYVQKVAEATHISFNPDTNIDALNMSGDVGLLESTILKDKNDTHNGEKLCVQNAINSSNTLIEEGGLEEGEISGDFEMDDNSFDVSSADALISEQIKVDEAQKTENVFGNTVYPCKIGNGEKEEGSQSNSFMVNALQDASSNGQVEPRTSNQIGIGCGTELAISRETIKFDKTCEYGSVVMPKYSEDRCIGSEGTSDMPTHLIPNQALHRGFLEAATTKDHRDSFALQQMVDGGRKKRNRCGSRKNKNNNKENDAIASGKRKCFSDSEEKEDENKQMVDASRSKKRGPGSEEKKDKKKKKYRQKRAEKNRELGSKRLKLPLPVEKPKIRYCRHYIKGRCHEGDKCKFSHDTVPLTKTTTPCLHFARQSCMKGDDCPFDHELSKYPCNKFVSTGSCNRGGSCMFSHQAPTNQGISTPANPNVCKPEFKSIPTNPNVCKPELKSPPLSGNTNFSKPLNNRGSNSLQQNHFTNSKGSYSHINAEHKLTDTPPVQPTSAPKGIKYINFPGISPSPSTPKQNMVTPNKENIFLSGTRGDQSASGTTQNIAEIPKKLPAGTPKGVNFLSFGEGPICSTRSFISSYLNRESNVKLPRLINSGLPGQASSSLSKDDYSQVSDRAKQSLPQTAPFSQEILDKNQSTAEGIKSKFAMKASIDDCKSFQVGEKASDNSQTPSVDSAMLLPRPFVSHQSSECLMSGYLKQASASSQRALLSTLAFAAELESDIKMKCTFASPIGSEANK